MQIKSNLIGVLHVYFICSLLLIKCCFYFVSCVAAERVVPYALSPVYLKHLANHERKICNAMKSYSSALETRLELIKRYTNDYENTSGKFLEGDDIADDPILAFRMLSRFAHEFSAIGQHMSENAEADTFRIIHGNKERVEFPTPSDFREAIDAILRFQFIYDLKANDIAVGNLPRNKLNNSSPGLSTKQCFAIGKAAKMKQQYTLALDWFDATGQQMAKTQGDLRKSSGDLLNSIISATINEHNAEHAENLKDNYEHIYQEPIGSNCYERKRVVDLLEKQYSGSILNESDTNFYTATLINNIALCRGQNFQTAKYKAKLDCWNDDKRHPYWKLHPLKVELLNVSPEVIQIYDVFNPTWIETLKTISQSKLERAPGGEGATPRTAAYAWFTDSELEPMPISRKIELITGLNVAGEKASELLQVAAYAFGGHVEPHYDSKGPDDPTEDRRGDRVMTFLVYLNDVKIGGLTSFPKLGFSVTPVAGSALIWNTNLMNGQIDPQTLHAACPLIYGHKWIATKWIYSNENMFRRLCDRDGRK